MLEIKLVSTQVRLCLDVPTGSLFLPWSYLDRRQQGHAWVTFYLANVRSWVCYKGVNSLISVDIISQANTEPRTLQVREDPYTTVT